MSEIQDKINHLQQRLDQLSKTQLDVHHQIRRMQGELNSLRPSGSAPDLPFGKEPIAQETPPQPPRYQSPFESKQPEWEREAPKINDQRRAKSDLEKFIGENLISKIGIVITVVGVGIGTKYAIDNNLISPLTRIILGYVFGFGLLTIAMRLKEKYENFSAVLLSGSMAIMYFVTFFAFGLYHLISQPTAFALMLIFTVFTVYMALIYDRVLIAHFGLVGAYTIPFLLSTGSENYAFLFSYMTIINIGILAVSVKKYWRSLFYSSFTISWLIFWFWQISNYRTAEHFKLALTFATVFFLIFYLMFLAYKSFSREKFTFPNVSLILTNSFVFYGIGYSIIDSRIGGDEYLGLFTIGNALIHFLIGYSLSKFDLAHRTGVVLTTALVLVFITIAIPVQFNGNWITLIWTAEAFFLFWLGRTNNVPLYEYFSYPLMLLASLSLLGDWMDPVGPAERLPLANPDFLTSVIFSAAFAGIHFVNVRFKPDTGNLDQESDAGMFNRFISYAVPAIFILALYNTLRIEIGNYFDFLIERTKVASSNGRYFVENTDLALFNFVSQINYSILFLTILSFVNISKIRDSVLGFVNLVFNGIVTLILITLGFVSLRLLQSSYLRHFSGESFSPDDPAMIFGSGIFNIGIRYVSYAFFAGLCALSYRYTREEFLSKFLPAKVLTVLFDLGLHFTVLVIACFELVNWMEFAGYPNAYKLGLSIIWGLYALFLIILGIYYRKPHLRISAIVLFAVSLLKLFFYDIAELDTISKTIVFVSIGVLLLIVSFLYAKYRHLIAENGRVSNEL